MLLGEGLVKCWCAWCSGIIDDHDMTYNRTDQKHGMEGFSDPVHRRR